MKPLKLFDHPVPETLNTGSSIDYEVAANLGDTDAMNEVARCYENGYGGKKDRVGPPCPRFRT